MRVDTVKTKVFKFDELTEEGQQAAMEKLYDINTDFEWYEAVYEDAENIGLSITGFDIDRSSYCEGDFNLSACEVAANIIRDHGGECETLKTAQSFLDDYEMKFDEDGEISNEDELLELEADFLNSLLEDYRIMLSKEYDYRTSEEAIKETIEANDYEFTADGKMY